MGGIPGSRGTPQRLRCVVRSGRFANCLHGRRGGSRDMHRPGNRIIPGLRPAARPYGATAPAPLAPILDGPTARWHLAFAERLRGPLDVAALRAALDTVTAHQDALRYRVSEGAGIVEPAGAVPLPVEDVAGRPDVLSERLAVLAGAAFDPTDRLWRLRLYPLPRRAHVPGVARAP